MSDTPGVSEKRKQTTAVYLKELRSRLLDLSNRNPLLNFRFTERSRNHVRVVNEFPDQLFTKLLEGRDLAFRALPEPEGELEDEKTEVFQLALERAHHLDEAYQNSLAGFDEDKHTADELQKEERKLKDRVRKTLGLQVRKGARQPSAIEHAKNLGISPEFDVPLPAKRDQRDKGTANRHIQTLLYPDTMERKLSGVYETARTTLQEKGVNTLYCAFGCLEWLESNESDRSHFAPLLLFPVEINRQLTEGQYRYVLRATGEEATINVTLREKLQRDFSLRIPDLEEDEQPESYFRRITEVITNQKKWRVRRFLTVGHFAFARLAMYQDLDSSRWPADYGLETHPVLMEILSGSESSEPEFSQEHEIDSPRVESSVPLLITDADSSQHSAIVDVMEGRNLVIEGPPGTGKSQTITNIIAAALSKGKTVLFVAEKMAALEVVKSRLDNAGLGHFCLELHSTKATKADVLESLRTRDELRGRLRRPGNLEEQLSELHHLRNQLTEYVRLLNRGFGVSDQSVHDLLWAEQRTRSIDSIMPPALKQISIKKPENVSRSAAERAEGMLRTLESSAKNIEREFGSTEKHPWRWVHRLRMTPFDVEELLTRLRNLRDELINLGNRADLLGRDLEMEVPPTITAISTFIQALESLPKFEDRILVHLLGHLSTPEQRATVGALVDRIEEFSQVSAELQSICDDCSHLLRREVLDQLRQVAPSVSWLDDERLSQLPAISANYISWSDFLDQITAFAVRALPELAATQLNVRATDLAHIVRALELIGSIERDVLLFRTAETVDELNCSVIRERAEAGQRLRELKDRLTQEFRIPSDLSETEVRAHAVSLLGSGLFGFLQSKVRRAKNFFRHISTKPDIKLSSSAKGAMLRGLADYLAARDAFVNDQRLPRIYGRFFYGLDTDFCSLAKLAHWSESVRALLPGSNPVTFALRHKLLTEPIEVLDDLRLLTCESAFPLARNFLTDQSYAEVSNLNERAMWMKERGTVLQSFIKLVESITLSPSLSVIEVIQLVPKIEKGISLQVLLSSKESQALLGNARSLTASDCEAIRMTVCVASTVSASPLPERLKERLFSSGYRAAHSELMALAAELSQLLVETRRRFSALEESAQSTFAESLGVPDVSEVPIHELSKKCAALMSQDHAISSWLSFIDAYDAAKNANLGLFLSAFEENNIPFRNVDEIYRRVLIRSTVKRVFEEKPELSRFSGLGQAEAQERFRRIDRQILKLYQQQLAAELASTPIDHGVGYGLKSEYTERALILNELGKKKRHIPIRELLSRAGAAIQQMKPCFMMSPLSVSQFLASGKHRFDLVVIDEASQMRPEDSLAAVARGKQLVVVGDPKQLPPTPFFSRIDDSEALEEEETIHSEAILDLAMGVFRPARRLRWHYRSRHGSLIAFSNQQFYNGELIIFPSPRVAVPHLGVQFVKVDGKYQGRINPEEVTAVVQAAVELMHEDQTRSIGIATLNQPQRELLAEEMDRTFAHDPIAAAYRDRWENTLEPFFIKNLENVQGDERDVILISTVYGPNESGKVLQRFGPINGRTGHRRLNVLFTRAKERVIVFSSMSANDIIVEETSSMGVKAFRNYLEFAATGRLKQGHVSEREPDSDFELFVAERLVRSGYEAVPQVGVSGYFIDLAIRSPRFPHGFLLGVECDGAAYHSAKSARDRDRLRQEVLESLGWRIYRIWSTDWFRDPEQEFAKLLAHIRHIEEEVNGSHQNSRFDNDFARSNEESE